MGIATPASLEILTHKSTALPTCVSRTWPKGIVEHTLTARTEGEVRTMCTVAVTIPDAVLHDTNMTVADAQSFARRMTAVGLYRQNNVSLGYCAQIADMSKADFIAYLGTQGVSIFNLGQ